MYYWHTYRHSTHSLTRVNFAYDGHLHHHNALYIHMDIIIIVIIIIIIITTIVYNSNIEYSALVDSMQLSLLLFNTKTRTGTASLRLRREKKKKEKQKEKKRMQSKSRGRNRINVLVLVIETCNHTAPRARQRGLSHRLGQPDTVIELLTYSAYIGTLHTYMCYIPALHMRLPSMLCKTRNSFLAIKKKNTT